jgi:hypothetical protein
MDWLKKHFDRVILAVFGVAVLASAAFIILSVSGYSENFATRNSTKRQNNDVPAPGTTQVKQAIDSLKQPKDWGTHNGSLLVSEPYILRQGSKEPVAIFRDAQQLFPPIENGWITQYSIDFSSDPREKDPDADKFSNVEEFLGKTDPTNPKSIPPYYTKLRLLQFVKVPFRLKFSGEVDTGVYSLNTIDLRGATKFVKIGEKIEGTPYKVLRYEAKTENQNGIDVDVSVLMVENEETGKQIGLVYDREVDDPTVYALLKNLWDGTEFRVKKLDSFSFKPEDNVKYKLIDISDERAVIKSPQGTDITVPKGQ